MGTISLPARTPAGALRPKRLLALSGDERLVEQIRRGNEAAFDVAFERHGPAILSFCRHMLGSLEEAEDAVQHTFAAAYRDLLRDERPIKLRPWLYAIARNRCLSVLRARREVAPEHDVATAGLDEQVASRAEVRDLLHDLGELPVEQRSALLLAEVGDLSHAEIAGVLGCGVPKVKALVFRARSGLIERREARETPCGQIREQLANLRGGSLRRSELRHHLRGCPGCRTYKEQVAQQRQMLAAVLPVTPSLGLKSGVLGAVGLGGSSAGGGAALGGLGAAAGVPLGSATLAKVAAVAVLAGGGAAAGEAVLDGAETASEPPTPAAPAPGRAGETGTPSKPGASGHRAAERGRAASAKAQGKRQRGNGRGGANASGRPEAPGIQGQGGANRSPKADGTLRGRGAPDVSPPVGPGKPGPPETPRPVRPEGGVRAHGEPAPKPVPPDIAETPIE